MIKNKYYLSVAEPWNFEGTDGSNVIVGEIINVINNQCLVFKSDFYLKFDKTVSNILILTPRFKEKDFSDSIKKSTYVNGYVLNISYNQTYNEKELLNFSEFKIIGNLERK